MKKLLCVVLWFLPVMLFAQSPFDGTWKGSVASFKCRQVCRRASVVRS